MPDTLAQRVRAKYPGVYDDLKDEDLETKVTAKFPGVYDDIPRTKAGGSKPNTDGFVPLSSVSKEEDARLRAGMSQDDWNAMKPADRAREMLKWGGKAVASMTGMGEAGGQAVENPGSTLATAAIGPVLGAAGRSAVPYIAPAARGTAAVLEHPAAGAAIGGVSGYAAGGVPGAAAGALAGMASGPRVARDLRTIAKRIDPPVSANAGGRLVAKAPPMVLEDELANVLTNGAPRPTSVTLPPHVPQPATDVSVRSRSYAPPASPPVADTSPTPAGVAPPPAEAPPPPRSVADSGPAIPAARPPSAQASAMSPQRIQNELGLTARRTGVKLSEEEYQAAAELVTQGKSPIEAVATTVRARPATATKFRMSQDEWTAYVRLRKAGKTHADAAASIETQRALAKMLGTPTASEARKQIASRQYKN